MYKLVAIDMDGTLLNSEKKLTKRTKKAIAKAREKGATVVLATGRPIDGVRRYLKELEMYTDKDYVLSYNGGLVLKTKSKEVICKIGLLGSDVSYLYDISKKLNVNIHAFSEKEGLVAPKHSKYTTVEADINGIDINIRDFEEIDSEDSYIKIMMIDEPEILEKAVENLPKEVYEKYTVVRSTPYFLEFLNKKVNKGTGMEVLAKHLGVKREEVIAIGDAGNDSHMIEYAGLGIAMGNAFDEIKEIADYITDTNNNDGVAVALEKFIINV